MLRRLSFAATVAVSLLACQSQERSTVHLDLSGMFTKQGLSLVPKSKVEFDTLLLVMVQGGEQGPTENSFSVSKVQPDPTTLTFETNAPVGEGFNVGLLAGTAAEDGLSRLDYMGVKSAVSFEKGKTTDIEITIQPAALLKFGLELPQAVQAVLSNRNIDASKLQCSVSARREGVLDEQLERTNYGVTGVGAEQGFTSPLQQIFRGYEPVLSGRYATGTDVKCGEAEFEIEPQAFDLAQSALELRTLKVTRLKLTGPSAPVATFQGFHLSVVENGEMDEQIVVTSTLSAEQPRLIVEAIGTDGKPFPGYTGNVVLHFYTMAQNATLLRVTEGNDPTGLLGKLNLRLADAPLVDVDAGLDKRQLPTLLGKVEARLYYGTATDESRQTILIVAEDSTNPHAQGYYLVNLGAPLALPCGNGLPQSLELGASVAALSLVEHESLSYGTNGQGLASNLFVGMVHSTGDGIYECPAQSSVVPADSSIVLHLHRSGAIPNTVGMIETQHLELSPLGVRSSDSNLEADLVRVAFSSMGPQLQRTFYNAVRATEAAKPVLAAMPQSVSVRTFILENSLIPTQGTVDLSGYDFTEGFVSMELNIR